MVSRWLPARAHLYQVCQGSDCDPICSSGRYLKKPSVRWEPPAPKASEAGRMGNTKRDVQIGGNRKAIYCQSMQMIKKDNGTRWVSAQSVWCRSLHSPQEQTSKSEALAITGELERIHI